MQPNEWMTRNYAIILFIKSSLFYINKTINCNFIIFSNSSLNFTLRIIISIQIQLLTFGNELLILIWYANFKRCFYYCRTIKDIFFIWVETLIRSRCHYFASVQFKYSSIQKNERNSFASDLECKFWIKRKLCIAELKLLLSSVFSLQVNRTEYFLKYEKHEIHPSLYLMLSTYPGLYVC